MNGDGCDSNCNLEQGYICQGGDPIHPDTCFDNCGDGLNVVGVAPYCDDGNNNPGDGCSSICITEDGVTCTGGT